MKQSLKITLVIFFSLFILGINVLFIKSPSELLLADIAIFYLALILVYFIVKQTDTKLRKLAMDVQEMAAGNLAKRVKSEGRDEISQLANSINELAGRLETNIAIDITKNKQIDQAKSDFVALASHQLRTPLSIIKWYIDFILGGDAGEIGKEQHKYLSEVYKANERLIELVNNLLDVSRIDLGTFSIEPEPSDLIAIAESVLKKVDSEAKKKELKITKIFDKLPKQQIDPRLTKIALENLLTNSVKYTPEHGSIKFEIKKTEDNVLIKVADTGCGIPRSEQPKIFSKLFRAENVRRIESIGTGLGLYIVKAVIEKSGGKIWYESPNMESLLEDEKKGAVLKDRNPGTAFYITIPLSGMKERKGSKKLNS